MNQKALILVDIQNDFCPGGSLAVPDGNSIVAIANEIMPFFDLVVATQDWHPPDHKSFASQHEDIPCGAQFDLNGLTQTAWPDHCIQGTEGAKFVNELNVDSIQKIFRKGTDIEIDSYSGFFDNGQRQSTGLDTYLKKQNIDEVYVMGLATDYCVKFTALDAVNLGFDTHLVLDGCRGVELNHGDIDAAIREMSKNGINVTESKQILQWTRTKPNQ